MTMFHAIIRLACIATLFPLAALAGCTRTLHDADVARAVPVSQWSGLDQVSRDGTIFFAGQPTADALAGAKAHGIRTVVNLRSNPEMMQMNFDEAELVRMLGMDYVSIPVTPDTFGPDDADRLKEVLERTDQPVLIHCGSSNRVGALWAMYLHRHRNMDLDQAIEIGRSAGLRSDGLVEKVRESAR